MIGALYINQPLALLTIIVIAILFALSVFFTRFISWKWYPVVIFAISMTLAFQLVLTSRYIVGYDAKLEYYVFRLTSVNGYWHFLPSNMYSAGEATLDSTLSVTILPTIYSALLNIDGEAIFKTLYPFVFSLVVVALYHIFERQIGKSAALLSTLFFVSGQYVFYGIEPLSLNRQIVAEFFLVLSILVLLYSKMSIGRRRLLLLVFGAALIVSHYSIMFIYLFLVFWIYAIPKLRGHSDEVLNSAMVGLLSVLAFLWYSWSVTPLTTLSQLFRQVFSTFLTQLSNPAARSIGVFSPHAIFNIASLIDWVFFYVANFSVLVGIIVVLLFKPAKTNLDPRYRLVTILCAVILFLCVVVPNLAPFLNLTRFYAITLLFLAPCFFLGGETFVGIIDYVLKRVTGGHFSSFIRKQLVTVILCAVLVGYFLSQSGFVNCVAGASPLSFSLDYNRIRTSTDPNTLNSVEFYAVYIPRQDVFGSMWLSKNIGTSSLIFADYDASVNVLPSYGLISGHQVSSLTNMTVLTPGAFIYLRQLNVANGIIATALSSFNTSEIYPIINATNLIYSNGNTEIWYSLPPN